MNEREEKEEKRRGEKERIGIRKLEGKRTIARTAEAELR